MRPVRVNVFGGRDVGKTTIAMHAAAELRWVGVPTALTYGSAKLWGEDAAIVDMRVFWRDPMTLTPHEAAEMCHGNMTFLVLRCKDYEFPIGRDVALEVTRDDQLENTLRSGRVRYKSLPGCRASVQYVVKKICERVGHGK